MRLKITTLPNLLTLFRIGVLPLMGYLLERGNGLGATLLLFLAAMSDFFDGYLARRRKEETSFGKLMDPVADKILLCVALLFLVAIPSKGLSPWLASLLLAREFLVTGLRAIAASQGIVIAAGSSGKVKVTFQFLGLGFLMIGPIGLEFLPFSVEHVGLLLLWIAVLMSYISMVQYSRRVYLALGWTLK